MEACALTGRRSTRTPADSSPAAAVGGQAGGWGPLAGVLSTSENKPATRSPRVGEASSPRGGGGGGMGGRAWPALATTGILLTVACYLNFL